MTSQVSKTGLVRIILPLLKEPQCLSLEPRLGSLSLIFLIFTALYPLLFTHLPGKLVADLTEFIFTKSILQPNFPIDQIKEIISQIPMASTLRKKWEMAIAFREGRLTDIMTVGKSMMGLETSNGDENLPVRQLPGDEKFKAFAQRLTIENLKTANSGLPAAPFMAMEFLTRTKMNGKTRMGEEKKVAEKKCE
ncbi:unnamed protein product [Caenorhabditis nigoni]